MKYDSKLDEYIDGEDVFSGYCYREAARLMSSKEAEREWIESMLLGKYFEVDGEPEDDFYVIVTGKHRS